ncbi:MAG: acetolactate synthase small subunit [Fibrobacterota bacterium]
MKEHDEQHTIILTVLNRVGVIARITGLFSARSYNIESIIAAPTENADIYKVYIVVKGTEERVEQVTKQLNKLIDIIKVSDISHKNNYIIREFILVKVSCQKGRSDLFQLAATFRAKIVDVATETMTIDLSGPSRKIDRFVELLKPYGIKELVRTGKVAVSDPEV